MTYEEKFSESEKKAHDHNIATKILRDMSVLRSQVQSNPNVSRRWIWELIQNAKDVHLEGGVSININYSLKGDSFITFAHNGKPFSTDNIRFLIEQISSKDRVTDESGKRVNSGKFGTGFLTTHLLSEVVTLDAVAKEDGLEYRQFHLVLDRSGFDIETIIESVNSSKTSVQSLDTLAVYTGYNDRDYNTIFKYPLSDNVSVEVAKAGLIDLALCFPLTLLFVPTISSLSLTTANRIFERFQGQSSIKGIPISSIYVGPVEGSRVATHTFARLQSGFTEIAVPIAEKEGAVTILPIDERIPTIFCDFPLVGTEKFKFPILINSPNFNPTDPRDGIFLTSPERANRLIQENKVIVLEAVKLYFNLLEFAVINSWYNLHLLARVQALTEVPDWIDEKWYNQNVLEPIREKLLKTRIITTANDSLEAILTHDGNTFILFPSAGLKETRDKLWELGSYWFPHCLPKYADVEIWNKIIWDKCGKLTLEKLADFVEYTKAISGLEKNLKNISAIQWLNRFYHLIKSDPKKFDAIVNKHAIFPDQNGKLCKRASLSRDKGDINPIFKDILDYLGTSVRSRIADESISREIEFDKGIGNADVVREITNEVLLKSSNRQGSKQYATAFKKLLMYFQEFPDDASSNFPTIYQSKHLLYDDDEVMTSITKAEQLNVLLSDFNVHNIEALRQLINAGKDQTTSSILPITENLLASMGITSIEEWTRALEDQDIADMFNHESVPTTDMFMYVQGLISKAKDRIIVYLRSQPEYDLEHLDTSTAPTILSGIRKDGKEISIVTRPAYDNYVIIYYGSERDILDYEPSELWIDDGVNNPRRITLGHILKKGKIVKFPI